jgi:hypothetical protein
LLFPQRRSNCVCMWEGLGFKSHYKSENFWFHLFT